MANDSSTGGYLLPTSTPPPEDDAINTILHDLVVGITGLAPTLVFPRWQPSPPTMPPASVNWAAIGVTAEPLAWDTIWQETVHYDDYSVLSKQQAMEVTASFYGPASNYYASLFADGMEIGQNLEGLLTFGIKLYKMNGLTRVPELINTQYIGRADLQFSLVRQIDRTYAIRNVVSAVITIEFDPDTPPQTAIVTVP